jgi:hypothetical protein
VAIKERILGPRHPALAGSLSTYAAFLRKTRGAAEAAEWEARARAIRDAAERRTRAPRRHKDTKPEGRR